MLTTLLRVTSGSGTIFGLDVEKEDRNVREKIGIALQDAVRQFAYRKSYFLLLQGYGVFQRQTPKQNL